MIGSQYILKAHDDHVYSEQGRRYLCLNVVVCRRIPMKLHLTLTPFLITLLTFMDAHKNLSVLPSNGPALTPTSSATPSISDTFRPLQSQICQKFNRGPECRVCNFLHICSVCEQQGHGAHVCQIGLSRIGSGNTATTTLANGANDPKVRVHGRYGAKAAPLFLNPPYHTAQAAIRVAQKKERRNVWQRWELQSPRYLAYRRKARSKKAGSKEDAWPDHVEEAFQIGLFTPGPLPANLTKIYQPFGFMPKEVELRTS